jgi:hypothetical protein
MQQHGRDPRDDADVRHAGLQRAGAKADRSRRCLRRSGQARCSSSPVRVRRRLSDAERGRSYDHAGACGRYWLAEPQSSVRSVSELPPNRTNRRVSEHLRRTGFLPFCSAFGTCGRQPFCLPCRRSWVRVPSAASEECPLPSGFRALQLAPSIRLCALFASGGRFGDRTHGQRAVVGRRCASSR